MRILKIMLPLLLLLLWGGAAKAQYDPASPPEPGVYFTLTTRSVPADAGYGFSGSGTRAFGSSVTMGVSGYTGYRFVGWEDEDGTIVSTTSSFTYVMPARNVVLTAHFIYDPTSPAEPSTPEFKDVSYISFKINPSDAGYMYIGSAGEYEVGTTKSFTARANSNYRFVNWTCEGIELGTSSTLEYTIPKGDRVLEANFAYDPTSPAEPSVPNIPRTLTLKSNPEGATYSFSGNGSHNVGTSFSVSQRSNTYYHFVNWTDEYGNVVSESSSFTYTMPDRHVTLTANYTYNYDPSSPGEPGTPNPDGSIAENMVLWPRMGMYDSTHVQILCETPGATIHYTLDGSTPNAESPVYTAPVFVPSNLLVKAIAYKEGMEDSPVVSYQVTAYKAGTPIFTFENLKLKITSSTEGATIRYTTDFTDPNEESDIYTAPFEPEENCRIKAYASKEGLADSPINIFVFRKADYTIPAPTLTMSEEGLLVITPSVSGGSTYYTLDGTDPTTASALYAEPLALDGNFTVRAYTVHPSYYDSPVGEYVIEGYQVADPTYEYKDRVLTLATATAGATVRYTTDGTVPTEESAAYASPLGLTEDCKVIAKGFKANYEPSDTISYTFVYTDHQAASPTLTYDPEALTITMACATENAEIRYTVDGEAPTATTGVKYEGPVAVTGNHTYTAKAFRSDLFDSETASVVVDDRKVPTPTASFANKQLTLSCSDAEASIHYTTDGTAPTAASTLYEAPVALSEDCTVNFIAVRQYFLDSDVASYEFKKADHSVAAPTLTYDPEALSITMTCATENAEIRYTIDGEAPTATTGVKYEGPVAVTGNHTYTAKAFRSDLFDSDVITLVVNDNQVTAPVLTYDPEALTITMVCATENAEIRYTIDGEAPTAVTGTVYAGPVAVVGNHTYTARAFRSDFLDSEVASFKVDDQKVAAPTASFDNHRLTLTCPDTQAQIRYTTDGSEPTSSSTLYEAPIALTEDCTVRFVAQRQYFHDSDIKTYEFKVNDHQVAAPTLTYDPEALTITMACDTENAEIRYTIDGEAPTSTTGTVYAGPVAVTGNHTYTARSFRSDLSDSDVASLVVDDHKVPAPTASFGNHRLTLTCTDAQARIRYTTDGSVPTSASTLYEAPIALTQDCTVRFVAQREYFHDSDIISYEFKTADHQVATPVFTYDPAAQTITMACATENAEIRYAIDGEAPTATTGTVYASPLAVTGNHTYTARAFRSDLIDSEVATLVVNDNQVAAPVVTHSIETMKVTMYCPTLGAQIRYTTDGSVPTAATGIVYTEPIDIAGNMTFTVRAFLTDFIDSEIVVYEVADMKLPKPTAAYGRHAVTLACDKEGAEIHYTLDGSKPTSASSRYSAPIPMTEDCTVRFMASKTGFNDSDEATYVFTLADWKETSPSIAFEYRDRQIVVSHKDGLPVAVTIGGATETVATPATLHVTTDMTGISATALAQNEDRYDSEAASAAIVFHQAPAMTYDGHTLRVALGGAEPASNGAELVVSFNGQVINEKVSQLSLDIAEFGRAEAYVVSDRAFISDTKDKVIDAFNTGRRAAARNGHRLAEVIGTWGDSPEDYEYISVGGELSKSDLETVASLPALTALHVEDGSLTEDDYAGALAGSRIQTVCSGSYPEGMLRDMPRLTTVIWNDSDRSMPDGRLAEANNPNILLWTPDESLAPADAVNTVVYEAAEGTSPADPMADDVAGTAHRITLQVGYPFGVHMPVEAESISLTKEFTLPTARGESAGWETLTVPFDVETISHEEAGEIKPFGLWTGRDDAMKPFWLYCTSDSTATGWKEATAIKAGTPYIISMPNNEEYVDGYSLPGKVTFAAGDVTLTPDGTQPKETGWIEGLTFAGTYMPVEETGIRSLNVSNAAGRDWLGSAFVEEDVTLPFGAYMRGEGMPRQIPVFGDWSGVMTPSQEAGGITVETPAPGVIRVSSTRDCKVMIVTPDGATVRVISLKGGESVAAEGLTRGLYIAAGVKVMVR